jgi:hypothetical protein
MAVSVNASLTVPVAPKVISATITLEGHDAQVLRSMLGALTRAERRAATQRNGGSKESGDRARFLVKELIDALDAQGVTRLNEVPITPPDQQADRRARGL